MASDVNGYHNGSSDSFSNAQIATCNSPREALLGAMERLEQAARRSTNEAERDCYSVATILCAHGASESLLHEWAKTHAPSTYEHMAGRNYSLLKAAEEVLPKIGVGLSEDLIHLANAKSALCDPALATRVSPRSWQQSAERATAAVRSLQYGCFPTEHEPG